MGIFLRCRQALVAQQFLNRTKISAPIQKVGRVRMSHGMGTDIGRQTGIDNVLFDDPSHTSRGKTTAAKINEKRALRQKIPSFPSQSSGRLQIFFHRAQCLTTNGNNPFLVSLARNFHQTALKIHISHIETPQLPCPESTGVKHFENGKVPHP